MSRYTWFTFTANFIYVLCILQPNNSPIPLRDRNGIEHLSNTVEATELSVNPLYYNAMGLHNLGITLETI